MAKVFGVDGQPVSEIELPDVFYTDYRPDIIKRAFLSAQSARKQPWGPDEMAGMRTSAEQWGKGYGVSRVPRIKGTRHQAAGRAAIVPHAVGGRKAHPPKPGKKLKEKVNRKERRFAIRSAISATKDRRLVSRRGHVVDGIPDLPLVIKSDIEALKKTRDVVAVLKRLGLWRDVERVMRSAKTRAGRGKMRGRRYKRGVGPLIVVGKDQGIVNGAKNIPGVEVCTVAGLNVERLAPGGVMGRLTLWTESAIEELSRGRFA